MRKVMMASDRRWPEVIDELPPAGDFNQEEWSGLLLRLSFYGGFSWIAPVLARGADPQFRTEIGDTAMSECLAGFSRKKPTFFFAALLEAGADANEICRGGSRILQLASWKTGQNLQLCYSLGSASALTSPGNPDHFDTRVLKEGVGQRPCLNADV
jgi:hypothetical protein